MINKYNKFIKIKGLVPGGNAQGKTIYDIVKMHNKTYNDIAKQIEIGKLVQIEHTIKLPENPNGNIDVDAELSLDNLVKNPNYYSDLIESGLVENIEALNKYIELFGPVKSETSINKYKEKFGNKFKQ